MTARDLLRLLIRRWHLLGLGAVLTLAGVYVATHQPGVYWTEFKVVLLAPSDPLRPNKIEDPRYALAPTAGLLAASWNAGHTPLFTATGDTTLFGEGQRKGVQVRVPNQGTQWQPAYYSPNISVQVVDSSPEVVEREARRVTEELNALLVERQDQLGIRSSMRLSTISSPAVPTVAYISGSRPRTALATGLAGMVTTVVGVYWIDRLLKRRDRRRDHRSLLSTPIASDRS